MPAFVESQLSAKDAADLAAYFATLPKPATPGKWKVEVPANAPAGQATLINMGCGQCHGATFNGPRGNSLGAYNMDFDGFANLVYNHTTAMQQYRATLGQNATNLDMGNFSRSRLTEAQLHEIYSWARDEIGPRAPMAGQIARIAGCRVVGTAGGQDKCDWLVKELGFDAAVDYKAGGVVPALRAACPNGIDVYFDNTGGPVLDAALFLMNLRGRVVCCGNVSQYDVEKPAPGPMTVPGLIVVKRIRMEGFIVTDFFDRRAEAEARLARWIADGRIKAELDILDGLERAPEALIGLFEGNNRGKRAVRVS